MFKRKKTKNLTPSESIVGGSEAPELPAYLAYALPHAAPDNTGIIRQFDDLELHEALLRSVDSFLNYDGVVLFAGAFEQLATSGFAGERQMVCRALTDLDLRQRQFFTMVRKSKFVVFLVSALPDRVDNVPVDADIDLFRRVLAGLGIGWTNMASPIAYTLSLIPEFEGFVQKYGTSYVRYFWEESQNSMVLPLCRIEDETYGLCLSNKIFALPCAYPQTHEHAVEMALEALRAVLAYRERISESLPEWIAEYRFSKEKRFTDKADEIRAELLQTESQIDAYARYKGALYWRSDPLVQVTEAILRRFLDTELQIDEKFVEDATINDENGQTIAVLEIKGVNGNFTRQNVNQVDSHRERLKLPSTTPGILIMNTIINASSLPEKDQYPHPDMIKKAVAENVLLIRTLDLLRYADAVDRGALAAHSFEETILSKPGWLKVESGTAEVVEE